MHAYAGYYVKCKLHTPQPELPSTPSSTFDRSGITQRKQKSRWPYRRRDNIGRRGVANYLKRLWCKGVGRKEDQKAKSGGKIKVLNVPDCYLREQKSNSRVVTVAERSEN